MLQILIYIGSTVPLEIPVDRLQESSPPPVPVNARFGMGVLSDARMQ